MSSTIGSTRGGNAGGVGFNDEDILAFDSGSGVWAMYFDGSDVGLTSSTEDVYGAWLDGTGDIFLTARGAFAVTGASGDGADIFTCAPGSTGSNTSCSFSLYWDGSAFGFAGEVADGFAIVR